MFTIFAIRFSKCINYLIIIAFASALLILSFELQTNNIKHKLINVANAYSYNNTYYESNKYPGIDINSNLQLVEIAETPYNMDTYIVSADSKFVRIVYNVIYLIFESML